MTESSLLTTHPTPNHYPVTAAPSLASPLPNGSLSDTNIQEEEEYTIKCICIYADDDGNTVYCPKCDTWQHIECYYHGKKVPEEHFCADCFPRDLDAKKATERQRRRREAIDGGDRKVKRPSSKTQKKKHKESNATAEQVNGWHSLDRHDSAIGTKDGPPAKKPKTNHRTSGSIVSMNGESRKRAVSNLQSYPSPSKSPQDLFRFPSIPTYTPDFLELYDRDEGNTHARDNEQTIQAANKLSTWRTDPSLAVSAPGLQPTAKSPFVRLDRPLDQSAWPEVSVETASKTDAEYEGRFPTWRFLRVQSSVRKDEIVGEVRGQVGMLEEYCQQKSSSNRWQELRHPDPFVFFHPHMDIYIDSRKSGTRFRYIRRSCRPNVTLKTFVSDDDETHHCFVASKDIPAGAELTTTWFLDQGMFSVDAVRDDSEQAQSRRLDWVSRVLANFGDCACDSSSPCLLANFDRRSSAKSTEIVPKEKGGRKKKSKNKHTISPLSTGQATNSRAGSEQPKLLDDEDQSDRRSTSESSPSNPQSRDITPVNVAALDADPVLGSGLTARELRKIQMAERAFAQKEQEKKDQGGQGPSRKKKRTSGGSTLHTPSAIASKQPGHASTSQPPTPSMKGYDHSLGSPPPREGSLKRAKSTDTPSRSEHKLVRPAYISVSVQTDPEESDMPMPPTKRRKFCTPVQRLLKKLLEDRAMHGQQYGSPTSPLAASIEAPSVPLDVAEDVEMKDAATDGETVSGSLSPTNIKGIAGPVNVGTSIYPLPSQAAHTRPTFTSPAPPRLHLSSLPPVPTFPATSASTAMTPGTSTVTAQSPLALTSSSPFPVTTPSAAVTPSPARKKLSLGDYMSRRLASTPSIEKTQAEANVNAVADASITPEPNHDSPMAPEADQPQPCEEGTSHAVAGVKEEGEEREYSPPEAVPPVAAESVQP
ncbi:SET domain-containing protein 3 [Exophiala xenobiotica]|nr:SET domain-containing protein 3 [Exophiala xenobiotica]